jgi:pimeloyl-ACP methyl ester carboxylesterase
MELRVGDAIAVLDALAIDRAHCIGLSWGGRLVFGIAEHAPQRVRSIVAVGQQPLAWPDSPLTRAVLEGTEAARTSGTVAIIDALELYWGVEFPAPTRDRWLRNDPVALADGFRAAVAEGPVARDLGAWRVPCLICLGSGDTDFLDGARRAAAQIPGAQLVLLNGADHYGAHVSEDAALRRAVLDTLRAAG